MRGKLILLICLTCVFIIPNANGMERIEETIFLTPGSSHQFFVSLEKGENISWEFETHDNPFLTTLIMLLHSSEFIFIEKEEGSYTIEIDETNDYFFAIYNVDNVAGYIHYIIENIENEELSISSYPIVFLVFFSIISLIVIKRRSKI